MIKYTKNCFTQGFQLLELLGGRNIEREAQEPTSGVQARPAPIGPLVGSRGKALDRGEGSKAAPLVLRKFCICGSQNAQF